ncbi:beta-galactosidase-like protein [Streptomyces sp. 846.5]|nr:beta-galactosidase-like protein [Streptomyces sp. 846.5]
MSALPDRILFGAAYYHEYQPHQRLKTDLDLMAEAKFSVIRVGESVWSTWEPTSGRFDLDWLEPVLDGAPSRQAPFLVTRDAMTPELAARRHRVLLVPGLYLAEDATLDWLAAYADHLGRARHEPAPGRLAVAAGVHYDEFSNLPSDLRLRAAPGSPLDLPHDATATRWADALVPLDAETLVEYDHPHFGRWPAVTTRAHGAGRVTCVGTVPGPALAQTLARWLAPAPVSGWRDLPGSVTATTGTSTDGRSVHIVHNWSWNPVRIEAPTALSDALDGRSTASGGPIQLDAWDVRVFVAGESR